MSSESDKKVATKVLSGFMELLPSQQIVFDRMKDTIARCFERFGFAPLDTPIIERSEVLLAKAGGETEKQVYRFMKGDNDLSLRFDLTVPLARYVSDHMNDLSFPFRRYQIGKVYRGERPQRGRFREFYQCDIDVVGRGSLGLSNDAEIPCVIYTTFKELGFDRFMVRVNNRKVLSGLFNALAPGSDVPSILRIIDKLEKIGEQAVAKEMQELGLSEATAQKLIAFLKNEGIYKDVLAKLKAAKIEDALFTQGVAELEEVVRQMLAFGLPESHFEIDLSIARGLDYYTGTVYETRMTDYPGLGSICSGGRYDDLASYFTSERLPGVGISIGLTRLFHQLMEEDLVTFGGATPAAALVIPMLEDPQPCLELAGALREAGIPIQVSADPGKFRDKMRYADRLGVPNVIIVGQEELDSALYSLKDMKTGEQRKLALEDLKTALTKLS